MWNDVHTLTLTVTAQNMDEVSETKTIAAGDTIVIFTLTIVPGDNRLFTLHAKNEGGVILFWAKLQANIAEGEIYNFTIELDPAGAGAATHIKLFRDGLPWGSSAMDSMLAREGFTPGPGENQYQIFPSDSFATVSLEVGVDMVIIVSDHNQNFYNNYAASQTKFNDFVYRGSTIFWGACDRGWAGGSILEAGITFPGGVSVDTIHIYDNYNLLYNPDYELVSGLPDTLYGTYASHETFTGYPAGTQIFTVNRSEEKPTLILYNHGMGWVILTGQPLEYCYDRLPEQTTGELLPRIVRFFLGKPPAATKDHYFQGVATSARKSSGEM